MATFRVPSLPRAVSLDDAPSLARPPTTVTAFVGTTAAGPTDAPYLCRNLDEFDQTFGGLTMESSLPQNVQLFFLNGGRNALVSRVESRDVAGAIDRLSMADDVNMVCVYPERPGADVTLDTWMLARDWCKKHRAMLFVDPPASWTDAQLAAELADGYDQLRDPNVMIYFPRIEAADPADGGRRRTFAPSGAVAGLVSRFDTNRGVWKAPAGLEAGLRGITGLEYSIASEEISRLTMGAVNCLRAIPQSGTIVWGARTTAGNRRSGSDWKYVPVRRLALHIEDTLERGLGWTEFEANEEALWIRVEATVNALMLDLFRQGAFAGASADSAWFVRCGRTTMTAQDINDGILKVQVGFAPLRPAEFVTVQSHRRLRRPTLA